MTSLRECSLRRQHGWAADRAATLFVMFEPYGGIAEGNAVAAELRRTRSQPLSVLGRWITGRDVFHFTWRSSIFLPRFQFCPAPCEADLQEPMPGMRRVLAELDEFFDDWEIAEWFATPNAWLQSRAPAVLLDRDADQVAEAARADRYVAKGW